MSKHTVKIGPMENGEITCDGEPVLSILNSDFNCGGVAKMRYDSQGALVDQAQSKYPRHIVHIDFPEGLHLQVMRWANHLNIKVTMQPRVEGQDGACGNFNNNP